MKVCPACGEQNPDKAKFCSECASPLGGVGTGDRRERRVVSVLFADLAGFTSRSERLDVEDVESLLARYHRLLRHELERHGGTVEKFIGDAVMALFGAPLAHEDDAERAVRAGLSIQDAMAQIRERDGIDLHVRVGVTTGEALIALSADPRAGEGMASGDVVNTAARLQSAAPVDGVLVDEATHRATDRAIHYDAAEPVVAKGKLEPVRVWHALEPRSLLPEQSWVDDLPLVGREQDIAQLIATLERSRREPSAQLATLVGAPGIGKTRLVGELSAHVEALPDLVRWRRGRSLAYGEGVALWALGEMVKTEAGILESDPAEAADAKLQTMVSTLLVEERDREWVARQLRPLVGLEATETATVDGSRAEAFAAWRRFFEALAEDGPTVLVFEDVHWADEALLDFIDLLADRAGAVPLLIVCTARPELLERRTGWSGGKNNAQTILVSPLSEQDTARLVGALLDQALLPDAAQQALLARAEGNPLYAQEYVRMLRDRGVLVEDGRGWKLVGDPVGLPESVQGIIAARLDTLADDERRMVQNAAVVGKTAWVGAVCALSNSSSWLAEELLHGLERKQLLRRSRRSSVAGEVEFSFAHALTQEVAYAQIPRVERAQKHERAAEWIERLAGQRDDKAELLAYHYQTAFGLRRQAGQDTTPLVAKTRAALAEAGRQAQAVNAHTSASRHLRAALDLTEEDDQARPRLLLEHAIATYRAGTADEPTLRASLDAQVEVGDWQAAAQVCALLSHWFYAYGGLGERVEEMDALGMTYATRSGYTPLASYFASRHAYRLKVTGRAAEVIQVADQAMRLAEEANDSQGQALMLSWHGVALANRGDRVGIAELKRAVAVLAEHGHEETRRVYHGLADALVGLGDLQAAVEFLDKAEQEANRFGRPLWIGYARAARAQSAYQRGDWEKARTLSDALCDDPAPEVAVWARSTRGRIGLSHGDIPLALADANRVMDWAASSADDEWLLDGLALLGLAYQAGGSPYEETCERFFSRWQETGGQPPSTFALAELAAITSQHDAIGAAARLLPDASHWKPPLIAIAQQRYVDAAPLYHEMGGQPFEAAARLLAAEANAEKGRQGEARRQAEQALSFYHQVEATHYAAKAEALLRASAIESYGSTN